MNWEGSRNGGRGALNPMPWQSKKVLMSGIALPNCKCPSSTHGHPGNACPKPASGKDDLCPQCYASSAKEMGDVLQGTPEPNNERPDLSTPGVANEHKISSDDNKL